MADEIALKEVPLEEVPLEEVSLEEDPVLYPWENPVPPEALIFDDGEPLESNRHRIAMNALIRSLLLGLGDRTNFFAGGNMFIYYSREQAMNRDFRGPDFFVVLEVDGTRERQGWVVWEENGRYPDVIVELLSPSTAKIDRGIKKTLYEQTFRTPDYFIFDPFDPNSLQGWHLKVGQGYHPLQPNEQGWLWCESLGLWLGTWEGRLDREPSTGTCHWLRFYDQSGQLVPLPEELAEQQAEQAQQQAEQAQQQAEQAQQETEQERQRAEQAQQETEQERQRAEQAQQETEQERQRAEQAQQQAEQAQQETEQERQRAEQAQQQAEQAQQQAEQAQQQAEQAQQQAERLAAHLRQLGVDPDSL